jgi:hypothetical protein
LGTLFTVQSAKLSSAPNSGPMQTLAWLAKNNRPPEKRKVGFVKHTWHPAEEAISLSTPDDAYGYAAEIFTAPAVRGHALEALGIAAWPIALVPVPASCTVRNRTPGERWPALAFAEQLAARGLGRVVPCVVNKKPTQEQTTSRSRTPAHEVAENLEVIGTPPRGHSVVFVDDVITWGARTAAMNHALQWTGPTAAMCIAFTNEGHGAVDCYQPKKRVIAYDPSARPWVVTISEPSTTRG